MNLYGKLIMRLNCKIFGHGRGKRYTDPFKIDPSVARYICPRCGTTWTRKVKKQPPLVNDPHAANRTRYEGQEKSE